MNQVTQLAPAMPQGFDADPARSHTPRADFYTSPDLFGREVERIFYRQWNFACHGEALREPGDFVTCRIMEQNVILVRGKDRVLRGFYNVCKHRAHELLQGCGRAKVITCPYHAWSFHIDGRLRSARGSEAMADFDPAGFALTAIRVEEYAGFVFFNLDSEAPSLRSQAGDLESEIRQHCPSVEKLTLARRLTYKLKANWKNVCDNFLECYHCTPAHPAFVDLVDIKNYRSLCHDIYSSHIGPVGKGDNKAYRYDAAKASSSQFAAWWLWPNVTFNIFPGCANITTLHIIPTGPETVEEHLDFYFESKDLTPEQEAAIRYADEVLQPEDIGLVESVQRGLHSQGYSQGRYIVDAGRTEVSEHALHHFHALVLRAVA
jgi:phenylpropionate dioxygenase-like ring-hydroxylating dioxygenase large terminal subunit